MGQAGVAQLAEQRFRKPQVGGSIPLAGSTNIPDESTCWRFATPLLSPLNSAALTVCFRFATARRNCPSTDSLRGEGRQRRLLEAAARSAPLRAWLAPARAPACCFRFLLFELSGLS